MNKCNAVLRINEIGGDLSTLGSLLLVLIDRIDEIDQHVDRAKATAITGDLARIAFESLSMISERIDRAI